jgi:hypothetical protein
MNRIAGTKSRSKIAVIPSLVIIIKSSFHLIPYTTQLCQFINRERGQILIQIATHDSVFITKTVSQFEVDAPE